MPARRPGADLKIFLNAANREANHRGLFEPAEYAQVRAFFDAHRDLEPTPLRSLATLARDLSIGDVLVKDETARFGVEAFKIAGVRYAFACLVLARLRRGVVCATAGNHGRAVARAAREAGVPCAVFLPAPSPDAGELELRTRRARIAAMHADGASTLDVPGTYEDAVERAAAYARRSGAEIVSDTSWPGYEQIPRLIMLGYTRIFDEASEQWRQPPDIVLIQGGVGGLVCAAASWFAAQPTERPFLIACEPESAACLLESSRAGRPVNAMEPGGTMMAGLRCAEPSPAAWPAIHRTVDAFLAIPDRFAAEALERLARGTGDDPPIAAGPSGACGVGALLALVRSPETSALREACQLSRSTRVLAVITEGP